MNNQSNVTTVPTQQAWEEYVDNQVLNVVSVYDTKPEMTFAQRMELMQDTLVDLSIELYNGVKDKAVRMSLMAYVIKIEKRLVV